MKPTKTLGILGGMGAVASAKWYADINSILAEKYHISHDEEYPQMYIHNLSMEGWSEKGIEDEKAVKIALLAGIEKMNLLEPDYVIIACNTAHIFFEELQQLCTGRLLNIIEVCVDYVKEKGYKKVGVLSSEVTRRYNLYQDALKSKNIFIFEPNANDQQKINESIQLVLSGEMGYFHKVHINKIINKLHEKYKVEAIILGCTELPLAVNEHDKIEIIDAGKVLLEFVLNKIYNEAAISNV